MLAKNHIKSLDGWNQPLFYYFSLERGETGRFRNLSQLIDDFAFFFNHIEDCFVDCLLQRNFEKKNLIVS